MTKKRSRKTKKRSRSAGGESVSGRTRKAGSISGLFSGKVLLPLLKLFVLSPGRDFYQRELADLTGEPLLLVQRGVARLAQAGLIDRAARGNRVYYRANRAHPAFEDLKALILKTVGLGDALRAQLEKLGDKVRLAFLYGSVARGEETASSDIDIMLVGEVSSREVASMLASVKRTLNREINPSVYRPTELRRRLLERQPFATNVLKEPKIFVLGNERDLEAILGRRSA